MPCVTRPGSATAEAARARTRDSTSCVRLVDPLRRQKILLAEVFDDETVWCPRLIVRAMKEDWCSM